MKIIYFLLSVAFPLIISAQEIAGINPDSNSDTDNFKLYPNRASVVDVEVRNSDTDNFKLYPNPSYNGAVHITTADNKVKDIMVYDIFGAIVLQDRITTTLLNISKLSPGVYVLQVTEEQKVMTRKLVVK